MEKKKNDVGLHQTSRTMTVEKKSQKFAAGIPTSQRGRILYKSSFYKQVRILFYTATYIFFSYFERLN